MPTNTGEKPPTLPSRVAPQEQEAHLALTRRALREHPVHQVSIVFWNSTSDAFPMFPLSPDFRCWSINQVTRRKKVRCLFDRMSVIVSCAVVSVPVCGNLNGVQRCELRILV